MDLRLCVLCGLLFAFAFESSCQVTNNIKCGEKTVLTCEAPSAPSLYMVWIADNTNLAVCTTAGCTATPEMPPNYAATQSATRTTFNLTINPVLLVDNRTFLCQVDAVNIKSMMVVPTVALLASNSTIATNEVADNATIIFTSNCIDRADQIHLTLEMKKVNSNDTFKTYPDGDINVIKGSINCTNSDNPDCGGNKTQKAHHKMTIKTANDGELYDFKLIAEYNGYETSFDNIGPFKLRSEEEQVTTTQSVTTARSNPPQNSSSWCDEDLNQCVTVLVVTGGLCCTVIVAVVIIFTKGNIFIVRFENIPTSTDIANVFQSKGLSITKSESDNNYSRHSSETVNRNCVVSTKNLIKTLPSTMEIGQITLKLSYKPGRKPFEYIYSAAEGSSVSSELNSPQNKTGSRPLPMPSNKNVLPPIHQ